jgi:predicted  nucleic acid-binding Zn-ribbon protein
MSAPITEKDIDQLENDLKVLKPQAAQLDTDITRVSTVRDQYKKEMKEMIQTVHSIIPDWNGNPDDLEAAVRKDYEVARIKTDNAREEIKAANEIMQPILKEIE